MATLTANDATPASGEGGQAARIFYAVELFDTEREANLRGTAIAVRTVDIPIGDKRSNQPVIDAKFTVDEALSEATRCRKYPDPFLNEVAIVVLADEIERLRASLFTLLPGLILDLRYAEIDDDKDAMRSRIHTVEEALNGASSPTRSTRLDPQDPRQR